MSNIASVEVFPVHIPMTGEFTFASGSAGDPSVGAPHAFVKVADEDGEVGWGEARPAPGWSSETLTTVVHSIRDYLAPCAIGHAPEDVIGLNARMDRALGRGPSTGQPIARAGLEVACHDLAAKRAGLPLREYIGGSRENREVELSFTVLAHDAAGARDEGAAAVAAGFKHVNFKAAVEPSSDMAVAAALREVCPRPGIVWADSNQGYTFTQAKKAAAGFHEVGVDLFEQPIAADHRRALVKLAHLTPLPIGCDEGSVSPADFYELAAMGAVDFLVIKLTRSGGIAACRALIEIARAAGLGIVVSGLTESLLAKCAVCQLALAYGITGPAALNGSQFLDESMLYPDKSRLESPGAVHLDDRPGIGIEPDESALEALAAEV